MPATEGFQTPLQIALVGNPNTGKTTLFNALTGLRQRIGNYPGITVSMATGSVFLEESKAAYITDLPGTYSLSASSPDEKIVHDYLNGNIKGAFHPDVVVCVVDATNIEKNLLLASQLAEHKIPTVIALTFWDSAKRRKTHLQPSLLSNKLGVPVIPVNVSKQEGIAQLKKEIQRAHSEELLMTQIQWDEKIQDTINQFRISLNDQGIITNSAEAQRLLFDSTMPTLRSGENSKVIVSQYIKEARAKIRNAGYHPHTVEALLHFRHISKIMEGVVSGDESNKYKRGESIDRLLTHKFWGMLIFVVFMYLVFQSVYSWSSPFMDVIDGAKGFVQDFASDKLQNYPQFQSLIVDGAIEGVGAFLIFLPQILILFFFISLLEETGYMARAAFLMDRLFQWAGLSGKSFIPLLSSFACAIPGILSTRTIEDRKSRLITIFIAPLMSCSARLPVYVLLIGALIEPHYGPFIAGLTLFLIQFLGLVIALPVAYLLNKFQRNIESKPFIIELPEYQIPKIRNVVWRMWSEGKEFVYRAGTIIFVITIVIWASLYYPRSESVELETIASAKAAYVDKGMPESEFESLLGEENSDVAMAIQQKVDAAYLNQSYLSRLGKTIQPVFGAAGFDWRISVGILASFPAREVIVSTLGVIFSLGGEVHEESDSLRDALAGAKWTEGKRAGTNIFTIPVAFAIMVFFALCQQCGATIAVIRSEAGTQWAIASFVFMTSLAWVASVITYQGLSLFIS